jgi:hypothetical protein
VVVSAKIGGEEYRWESFIYWYTPSCPLHRTTEQQEVLWDEMWVRRKRYLGRQWRTVYYGNASRMQVDQVYYVIATELEPEKFKHGIMRTTFSGSGEELTELIVDAKALLKEKTKPKPQGQRVLTPQQDETSLQVHEIETKLDEINNILTELKEQL